MAKEVCKRGKYWTLSTGEGPSLTDGGNETPPYLFIQMDELAKQGQPIVLETESDKVLDKAAEYAAQKGYELVSPNPEQNLIISNKLNDLAGEEIAEGHLLPSQHWLDEEIERQRDQKLPGAAYAVSEQDEQAVSDYRPFSKKGPDKLPDGFESEVRVHPVVIREGSRMTPELPENGDNIQHWEAVRVFHQKDLSAPPISGDDQPRLTVERQAFATQEEAIAAAQGMASTPASREVLQKARKADYGEEHPRTVLLNALIAQPEPEQKAKTAPEQEESAADIAADIGRIAQQSAPLQTTQQPFPQPLAGGQAFPEKRPAQVLEKRLFVPAVKDHGNRITVTRMGMAYVNPKQKRERDDRVARSLQMARERFGDPVRVDGNSGFEQAVIKAAIAQGIPLEMASDRGEKAYQLALQSEKKRGLEKTMGSLSPSKDKQVEKGRGRGLAIGA